MQGLAAEIYQIAHGSDKIMLIHDMFEIGRLNSMISLSVAFNTWRISSLVRFDVILIFTFGDGNFHIKRRELISVFPNCDDDIEAWKLKHFVLDNKAH